MEKPIARAAATIVLMGVSLALLVCVATMIARWVRGDHTIGPTLSMGWLLMAWPLFTSH